MINNSSSNPMEENVITVELIRHTSLLLGRVRFMQNGSTISFKEDTWKYGKCIKTLIIIRSFPRFVFEVFELNN